MGSALGERDARGVVEDGGDLGVNIDELVGLGGDPLVSAKNLSLHPFIKLSAGESGEDVDNPLLWQPGALLGVCGEIGLQGWVIVDVGIDLPEPEALVLGHVALGDFALLEELLPPSDDVLHEV